MKHRHSGPKVRYITRRGRIKLRKRPMHKQRPKWKNYQKIVNMAKRKGYKVGNINRRNLTADEVDIPEVYRTDGIIIPDHEGKQRRDLIYIDDDATKSNKEKAFAHELGHLHLFNTKQDDEESNSNIPSIERKADKIGADILGMTVKDFNSPDATYKDVRKGKKILFFSKSDDDINIDDFEKLSEEEKEEKRQEELEKDIKKKEEEMFERLRDEM